MSYRSIKRHLGESHLQRKFLALFGVFLTLMIGASFSVSQWLTDGTVTKQNSSRAEVLVDSSLFALHWQVLYWQDATQRGEDWKERDKEWKATMDGLGARLKGRDYDCSFLRPAEADKTPLPDFSSVVNVAEPVDDFEARLLDEFTRAPDELAEGKTPRTWDEQFVNNGAQYEYFRPVYAQQACLNCHRVYTGPPDLAEGQLIAVAKVTISNAATRADQNWNRAILWTCAIVIAPVAILVAYLIVRYVIVKPLKHLRDVSDAVSRGNLDQRAEIRTADEFEDLAVAFNRMLAHLVTAQEELKRLNSQLDLKVDELAQANMRLFELNRLKSDFLATMSHELRTPLNSIIGFSDVLSSIKSLDEKQLRYVQNIQKSGKMLLDMINDILDLAKIESGKMELRPSDFYIDHVIGAQCDMARPLAERKNLDLEMKIEPDLPELLQDQGKVQQILNNLLSNAIKFTPDGGRIVIGARHSPEGEMLLTVADTGVGISEGDQAHIFEKFRQGKTVMPGGDAMTREYEGTGLGLSIVKELCKLLGGDVSVESELGKGSVFAVRLPWRVHPALSDRMTADGHAEPALAVRDELGVPPLEMPAPSR
ncbi:MAG TPA: ATP-binding protein [Pirellulales bacterium]|nr:ATP-binding protein [Pirellulales bacterium]